jgi:hypothetical protein
MTLGATEVAKRQAASAPPNATSVRRSAAGPWGERFGFTPKTVSAQGNRRLPAVERERGAGEPWKRRVKSTREATSGPSTAERDEALVVRKWVVSISKGIARFQ